MNKVKLALVGKEVSKSASGKIHKFILENLGYTCEYALVSLNETEFDKQIPSLLSEFDGFNVTMPYKAKIIPYLQELCDSATAFHSVNTVVCKTKKGYNTDGVGFMQMLKMAGVDLAGKTVLVLGVGGAGKSTAISLKQAGAKVFLYRKKLDELDKACQEIGVSRAKLQGEQYDVIINATGVGMNDTIGKSPVDERVLKGASLAIDLIYRPAESGFLRLAKGAGLRVLNGKAMLFYQAYYSDCYYVGKEPSEVEAENLYIKYCEFVAKNA